MGYKARRKWRKQNKRPHIVSIQPHQFGYHGGLTDLPLDAQGRCHQRPHCESGCTKQGLPAVKVRTNHHKYHAASHHASD